MTTFISYSRVDSNFVLHLAKDLKSAGIDVWLDQLDIPKGSRWDDELEKALRNCDSFLIVLTPASIISQNVKDEIGYAIDTGKHILPVMLEACDIPIRLRRFQYIDFTGNNYEERFAEIKSLLANKVQLPASPRAEQKPPPAKKSDLRPRSRMRSGVLVFLGGSAVILAMFAVIYAITRPGFAIPFTGSPEVVNPVDDSGSQLQTLTPAPAAQGAFKVVFLGTWGSEGDGDGQFRRPWGIGVNWSAGQVYVGDDGRNEIQVFSSTGEFLGKVPGYFSSNFLALDSDGRVYVLNYDSGTGLNNRVEIYYFGEDQMLGTFPLVGQSPRAIDTGIYGTNIYVTDISDQKVYRFGSDGQVLSEWGSPGSAEGQFFDPWGIAVDRYNTGNIYVADTGNNRIQVFSPEGTFLRMWGSKGTGDGEFDSPIDVAVDTSHGFVYVLDRNNARVQVFTPEGEFLGKWGTVGRGDQEFLDPYGIAIDSNDYVFVLDSGNYRVQSFIVSFVP
jgi:DNA-binding beta-propeller fold protein YncE